MLGIRGRLHPLSQILGYTVDGVICGVNDGAYKGKIEHASAITFTILSSPTVHIAPLHILDGVLSSSGEMQERWKSPFHDERYRSTVATIADTSTYLLFRDITAESD